MSASTFWSVEGHFALVAGSSRSKQRPIVVLPEPDSPTKPERLAAWQIEKLTPSTALTSPTWRENKPGVNRKVFDEVLDLKQIAHRVTTGALATSIGR